MVGMHAREAKTSGRGDKAVGLLRRELPHRRRLCLLPAAVADDGRPQRGADFLGLCHAGAAAAGVHHGAELLRRPLRPACAAAQDAGFGGAGLGGGAAVRQRFSADLRRLHPVRAVLDNGHSTDRRPGAGRRAPRRRLWTHADVGLVQLCRGHPGGRRAGRPPWPAGRAVAVPGGGGRAWSWRPGGCPR
jgi:hypothetical protein